MRIEEKLESAAASLEDIAPALSRMADSLEHTALALNRIAQVSAGITQQHPSDEFGTGPGDDEPGDEPDAGEIDLLNEDEEKEVTRDMVRESLKSYMAREGKEAAIELLKKHNATNMSDLPKMHYNAVHKKCQVNA